jgi:3-hydroxybutyryl-CoA dehydrogenase
MQRQLVSAGRFGRKTGRGFYEYADGNPIVGELPAAAVPSVALGSVAVVGDGDLAEALKELSNAAALSAAGSMEHAAVVVVAALGPLEVRRLGVRNALEQAGPDAVVAAHCAPYTVTEVTSTLRRAERVAGFSIVGDPRESQLVEVAGGVNTLPEVVDGALSLFGRLGKRPVRVGDGPGMVLARVLSMIVNEAAATLDDGVATAEDIDTAIKLGVAYPLGPLEWADRLGLDVVFNTMRTLQNDYGDPRYRSAIGLRRRVQAGHLGTKTGRGFF